MAQKRLHRVKCRECGATVGVDRGPKEIEKCWSCHSGKKTTTKAKKGSPFRQVKRGPAPDLPKKYRLISFRSSWERNFARVLSEKKIHWTYEKKCFLFHDVKRRPFVYIPDFHDEDDDVYWEVKGRLLSSDRSKMRRMKNQYPNEFKRLRVCLSKRNKAAIRFYKGMKIPITFMEDLKDEWSNKVKWE